MCEHAMAIIIDMDSQVELPGLKSLAMASRIPASTIARAGAKSSDGSPKLVPGKRTPKTPAAAIRLIPFSADFLEVVGGYRARAGREYRATGIGQFFGVYPRLQSSPLPGPQDSFRFFP